MSVGRNAPDPIGPPSGREELTAESNSSVTLVISGAPPQSDIKIVFCPVGPTSSISMSSGNVWLIETRVTVTLATGLVTPETTMSEG